MYLAGYATSADAFLMEQPGRAQDVPYRDAAYGDHHGQPCALKVRPSDGIHTVDQKVRTRTRERCSGQCPPPGVVAPVAYPLAEGRRRATPRLPSSSPCPPISLRSRPPDRVRWRSLPSALALDRLPPARAWPARYFRCSNWNASPGAPRLFGVPPRSPPILPLLEPFRF